MTVQNDDAAVYAASLVSDDAPKQAWRLQKREREKKNRLPLAMSNSNYILSLSLLNQNNIVHCSGNKTLSTVTLSFLNKSNQNQRNFIYPEGNSVIIKWLLKIKVFKQVYMFSFHILFFKSSRLPDYFYGIIPTPLLIVMFNYCIMTFSSLINTFHLTSFGQFCSCPLFCTDPA